MEFRKFMFVISITIVITIFFMFGISYGWYAYKNAETFVSGSTIKDVPTIIFTESDYIYFPNTTPIYDEDRYNYAYKNAFSITLGENLKDYENGIEISLKDIMMSNELKNVNYKYELLENGDTISKGDFSNLGNDTVLVLKPITVISDISYPKTYIYELYIWLSDDGTNQNALMNKTFSAKINVNSAIKKIKGR